MSRYSCKTLNQNSKHVTGRTTFFMRINSSAFNLLSAFVICCCNYIIQAYSSFTSNMSQRPHFMAILRILAACCTRCHNVLADDFYWRYKCDWLELECVFVWKDLQVTTLASSSACLLPERQSAFIRKCYTSMINSHFRRCSVETVHSDIRSHSVL